MATQRKVRLGVLGSGRGSNFQAILESCQPGGILYGLAEVVVVISNNSKSGILQRAQDAGIENYVLNDWCYSDSSLDQSIKTVLQDHGVELVILAGYMKKIGPQVIDAFPQAILNIHPAVDINFGGKGFYGLKVHEAVIAYGEKISGATVHIVDGEYDHGPILLQGFVSVVPTDTPESLAAQVLKIEHQILPMAIRMCISGCWS